MKILTDNLFCHRFIVDRKFDRGGGRIDPIGIEVESSNPTEMDENFFLKRWTPVYPSKVICNSLTPLDIPGSTHSYKCGAFERIEVPAAIAVRLVREGKAIPEDDCLYRPRGRRLKTGRDKDAQAEIRRRFDNERAAPKGWMTKRG